MFDEAWRLMRDHFWAADMSGVDWKGVRRRYRPLVDRVATRSEFSDLVWETQGELGTSHCYEVGGDYRAGPRYAMGMLGAEFAYNAKKDAYRITHIVRGDSWKPRAGSPLLAPGVNVKKGDHVAAINGKKVGRHVTPQELLVGQAGQEVTLTLDRGRRVTVRTLPSEYAARYREWVRKNREQVHKRSKGRVGYVHIPDMGPAGYSEFHRQYLTEVDHEGLLVDVRFNGGGHVSQLILEKLARRRIGYDIQRWGQPLPYPGDSPAGPLVALTNEMAGSDGDIFSHGFKLFRLGPLVGRRTWGGVIGIWPRHPLVDGSVTTQPEFSFWFRDVGFGVENHGTDPDVDVDVAPHEDAAGKDPQLETALKVLLDTMKKHPWKLPKFEPRPKRKAPRLPRK
ncbi:MAG: PDZ domain-containing protein, partial [Planctomycetota bacterium]|jgi:tricorn protease